MRFAGSEEGDIEDCGPSPRGEEEGMSRFSVRNFLFLDRVVSCFLGELDITLPAFSSEV